MNDKIVRFTRTVSDEQLLHLAGVLGRSLDAKFAESRAKALLMAAGALDETTLNDFRRVMANEKTLRIALADLMESAEQTPKVDKMPFIDGEAPTIEWISLGLRSYADKLDYPVDNLDPSTPPGQFSPAGQVVHQASAWMRRQVKRSATDRDKTARRLAYVKPEAPGAPEAMPTLPPVPSSIPVRHYEYNEPIAVDPNSPPEEPLPPLDRSGAISITLDDLEPETPAAPVMPSQPVSRPTPPAERPSYNPHTGEPEIHILGDSRSVAPLPGVPVPPSTSQRLTEATRRASDRIGETVNRENAERLSRRVADSADSLITNIRQNIGSSEPLGRTRLKVFVMDYPNGHPLPAVQVFVKYVGSRQEVAGTTAQDGEFIVSLPARRGAGLTYEVAVHWPQSFGGQRERKRITVNADRGEFELPFYSRLVP